MKAKSYRYNIVNHALHGIIYLSATSNKKSTFDRASFLPAELIELVALSRAFLLPFLRTLGEQVVNSNVSNFY